MPSSQSFESMSLADQHTVRLHLRMLIMRVREIPTREARVKEMVGNEFSGPHRTGVVVIDTEFAGFIADQLDMETPDQHEAGLQHLAQLRASYARQRST